MIDEDAFGDALTRAVETCIHKGFQPPLVIAAVSVNGYAMVLREHPDDGYPDVLAEPSSSPAFVQLPIHLMIIDASGKNASTLVLEASSDRKPCLRVVRQENREYLADSGVSAADTPG